MAKLDVAKDKQESGQEFQADEVFSSEKREDVWAIIIALGTLILSVAFPEQIYLFFKNALYLF